MDILKRIQAARKMGAYCKQRTSELLEAADAMAAISPKVFVEIGSYRGGSLYVYAGVCQPGATLLTIDDGSAAKPGILERVISRLLDEGLAQDG